MGIDAQMLVKIMCDLNEDQVLSLAYDLAEAFGHNRFWISREGKWQRHCLKLVDEYTQDGPPIRPREGERLIDVSLRTRYYGAGYERGDLVLILAVAAWLRKRIPNSQVWYGGDSSGVLARQLDDAYAEELWQHFVTYGHKPYEGSFFKGTSVTDGISTPSCDFCKKTMTQYGSGGNYAAFSCCGCGYTVVTRDGGKTWDITDRSQ